MDLNQLKLDWVTSEAKRLKQRIIRIHIDFKNAFNLMSQTLEHLTSTGKALGISHGMVGTEQFNNIAFMDDITTLAQDNTGSQILLNAIQEFEDWSNMRLNLGKTVVMDIDGGSGQLDPPKLTYKKRTVKTFQAEESCRHLGFWATPNGDMAKTKQRVLAKTREVLGLLTHHPTEDTVRPLMVYWRI